MLARVLLLTTLCVLTGCAEQVPGNRGATEPGNRSFYYDPPGNICRKDAGRFASWDFFTNPLTCKGCNVIAAPAGLDGDEFTAASILIGTTADGTLSIFAKAPPGVVFPAGSQPAVLAFHERTAPGVILQADVRTYLNGEMQDQAGIDFEIEDANGRPVNDLDGNYAFNYVAYGGINSVQTTQPFDTLELFLRFGPGFTEHIQVYDFCVDIAQQTQGG
jgi:hypothetical protein